MSSKFDQRAETVTAEFLFSKWLTRALASPTEANRNGLVASAAVQGNLQRNLSLVQDALTGLISSQEDYVRTMRELPYALSEVCESRREQAKRFMRGLVETRVADKTLLLMQQQQQ